MQASFDEIDKLVQIDTDLVFAVKDTNSKSHTDKLVTWERGYYMSALIRGEERLKDLDHIIKTLQKQRNNVLKLKAAQEERLLFVKLIAFYENCLTMTDQVYDPMTEKIDNMLNNVVG